MSTPHRLNTHRLIEEETVRGYKAEHFYPVKMGEIFRHRYETVGKLGYGSASTVWLCRDREQPESFVALKIYINNSKVHRELQIYHQIARTESKHQGRNSIRKLLDSFEIQGPHGIHTCLVHEPLGNSLEELRVLCDNGLFSSDLVRQTLRPILHAIQFLHEEAHVIHTDLQPNNILLGVHDPSILEEFVQMEYEEPSPLKELEDRTIYVSRAIPFAKGPPSICDFSEARSGHSLHNDLIMPDVYRAPEVILGMPWSYQVDIWCFAMVLWDLFEPSRLFQARGPDGKYSQEHHLAQMVSILGPPPLDFIRKCREHEKFWDQNGVWIGQVPVPDTNLELVEKRLVGHEKYLFLAFMKKMLRWAPEERGTFDDVFWDEWLLADLIGSGAIKVERDAG